MFRGDAVVQPVTVVDGDVLVAQSRGALTAGSMSFAWWLPGAEGMEEVWRTPEGRQDVFAGLTGHSAIVLRIGFEFPFPEWEILQIDLATGVERRVAEASGDVRAAEFEPPLPFGFAAFPAVGDGTVAWVEHVRDAQGAVVAQLVVFEPASGTRTVEASARLADGEDLGAPAIGGSRLAWSESRSGGQSQIVTLDLVSGVRTAINLAAHPRTVAVSGDGATVAWDDARGGRYLAPAAGGEPASWAVDGAGWGVTALGARFGWFPGGGRAGFLDLSTGEVWLVRRAPAAVVNFAGFLGEGFGWQELYLDEAGRPDAERSGYFFVGF
jgi:hypothetical protein